MSSTKLSFGAYQLEKLDGDNFSSWKLQMKSVLITNDLFEYVDGSKPKPESDEDTEEQRIRWKSADEKALAIIILGIKPTQLIHVKNCKTSREAWSKMHEVYQPRGPARKITLFKQLLRLKKQSGESMQSHINQFFVVVDKLVEIESPVPVEFLSIILLCSLPDDYENFCIAIESRDALPDLDALKVKILEEEARRKEKADNSEGATGGVSNAFLTKTKNAQQGPTPKFEKKKQPFKYKCYSCGRQGHRAIDCRNKKTEKPKPQVMVVTESILSSAISGNQVLNKTEWCIDSGATSHMCCNKEQFVDMEDCTLQTVQLADKSTANIKGIGTVIINTEINGEVFQLKLQNVLYVPNLQGNLISVPKATVNGYEVNFQGEKATVINKEKQVVMEANKRDNLYIVCLTGNTTFITLERKETPDFILWHKRFGHLNVKDLSKLKEKDMVLGLQYNSKVEIDCDVCMKGKLTKLPFPQKSNARSENVLDLVHTDICGPMRTQSLGGAKYFVTFIDDKSRIVNVYFLKERSEVFQVFKKYKEMVETQTGKKMKALRSDNAKEYCSKEFDQYLESCGCKRQFSVEYTPEQNGVSERCNRTLVEMARCLLIESGLPVGLWAEAVSTAAYIRNRSPTSILNDRTPFEVWYNKKPSVSHFRVFGCKAFALIKNPKGGKFDEKSREYSLVGYSDEYKAYRLYDRNNRSITCSRDVKFMESSLEKSEEFYEILIEQPELETNQPKVKSKEEEKSDQNDEDFPNTELEQIEGTSQKRRPGRPFQLKTGKPGRPKKVYNMTMNTIEDVIVPDDPKTIEEALSRDDADKWKQAMQEEYDSLTSNHTWELVDKPSNRKTIGCKWVFHIKKNSDGSVERYKARLVAKGFTQEAGLDYSETFSPVMRYSSLRTIFAIAAEREMHLHQLDVTSAYLHGELQEEIYMEQPDMFMVEEQKQKVCRLKRTIYGLRQAGREWNNAVDKCLKEQGFQQSESDSCIYTLEDGENSLIVAVYVDDILVASKSKKAIEKFKKTFALYFKVKDKGPIHYCLGIEVLRDMETGSISINHERYIQDLLTKYGMLDCKSVSTPLDANHKLTKTPEKASNPDEVENHSYPYRELVGSLMHLAVTTRPDLAYTVSVLSQYCSKPNKIHWMSAKRVLRYLKGTSSYGLLFQKSLQPLVGYTDADWGGSLDDRRSYTGYSFILAGGAISWESRKQKTVALSSTEAEYIALTDAAKEAVYLRNLLKDLGAQTSVSKPTVIHSDNQSAQHLVKNPVFHARTKHIDIRYHFVRQVYTNQAIDVKYLPTNKMIADVLTKSLFGPKHVHCSDGLGMCSSQIVKHRIEEEC